MFKLKIQNLLASAAIIANALETQEDMKMQLKYSVSSKVLLNSKLMLAFAVLSDASAFAHTQKKSIPSPQKATVVTGGCTCKVSGLAIVNSG